MMHMQKNDVNMGDLFEDSYGIFQIERIYPSFYSTINCTWVSANTTEYPKFYFGKFFRKRDFIANYCRKLNEEEKMKVLLGA